MKKSLLILMSLFCLKGFSQSSILVTNIASTATVAPNAILNSTTAAAALTTIMFDVKNTSSSTKSYIVKRYDIALNAVPSTSTVAEAYFCFAGGCYPNFVMTSPAALTLTAGQSASSFTTAYETLSTDLAEASAVGYSQVKYSVINAQTPGDSVQFTIKYNAALGIAESSNNLFSSLELFPNPAVETTILKVHSQKAVDATVIVYNALGAVVAEKPVGISEGKNRIELNINDLSSGVYFAQIKMGSSSVTRKLVVK